MMITANLQNLTRSYLPSLKRQINRIAIINTLLKPLYDIFNEFIKWQQHIRSFRVTSQVCVLESYLSDKYNVQIIIETSYEGGIMIAININEGNYYIDSTLTDIPLKGEMQIYFENCDFIVHVPNTTNVENIRKDVERFRRAGRKVMYTTY